MSAVDRLRELDQRAQQAEEKIQAAQRAAEEKAARERAEKNAVENALAEKQQIEVERLWAAFDIGAEKHAAKSRELQALHRALIDALARYDIDTARELAGQAMELAGIVNRIASEANSYAHSARGLLVKATFDRALAAGANEWDAHTAGERAAHPHMQRNLPNAKTPYEVLVEWVQSVPVDGIDRVTRRGLCYCVTKALGEPNMDAHLSRFVVIKPGVDRVS